MLIHFGRIVVVLLSIMLPQSAATAQPPLGGRIKLQTQASMQMLVYKDDYGVSKVPRYKVNYLPPFNFEYVQYQQHFIPIQRGSIAGPHPMWEYILEPGTVTLNSTKGSMAQIVLPFSLQERNANCMHHGLLRFSLSKKGTISKVEVSIDSETCANFKFSLRGVVDASFKTGSSDKAQQAIAAFKRQRAARLPVQPINTLQEVYSNIDLEAFSGGGKLPPEDTTIYGFVMDGVHYRSECATRRRPNPFCDDISLPSYSLAKSLFAGLAAMRMEKLYPGTMQETIAAYVPQCIPSENWQDISFSQTLNMLTGNYLSAVSHKDEASADNDSKFFAADTHEKKIDFACNHWPRKSKPGKKWVYHSSDTYLLGTALNAKLKSVQGKEADIFRSLLLPLWQDLQLSPGASVVRRSYDEVAQPFTGYGMTFIPDDIARLATVLNRGDASQYFDSSMYNSAMQRLKKPQGSFPADTYYYYSNGFWAYDARRLLGCKKPVMIPFMSGYGGINVVMMPNDSVYYIFGDSGKFAFADMLKQSHKIRSMCPAKHDPTKESQ